MDCSIPDFSTSSIPSYISKITSTSTPERSFYISNTIDLGQVLMLGFLILILVFSTLFVYALISGNRTGIITTGLVLLIVCFTEAFELIPRLRRWNQSNKIITR